MSTTSPMTILSIYQIDQTYFLHMQAYGGAVAPTAIFTSQTVSDVQLHGQVEQVTQLLNQLLQERTTADPLTSIGDPLLALGRLLYNQFFSIELQQALHKLPNGSPLLIATNASHIPWELAHDGDEYLALKFRVARQLLLPHQLQRTAARTGQRWSALLIGNPSGDLPEAAVEIEQLAQMIEATPGTAPPRIFMRHRATKEVLLQELASGTYQLIHYSGHTRFDDRNPDATGLILANRQILTAQEIRKSLSGAPFVFLNGCESAKGPTQVKQADASEIFARNLTHIVGLADSLASAFIQGGAAGFLGTVWPIHDVSSRKFAFTFYRTALEGTALAQAVRQARQQAHDQRPFDPLWASYTLFAEPMNARLVAKQRERCFATILAVHLRELDRLFEVETIEEASGILEDVVAELTHVIKHYGGHVQTLAHDLLICVFGYPTTHTNNAERAVHAGLEMIEHSIITNENALSTFKLSLGIGISSGDLIVSTSPHNREDDVLMVGQGVNQAIQLAHLANATIFVDRATYRLTGYRFQVVSVEQGPVDLAQSDTTLIYQISDTMPGNLSLLHTMPSVGRTHELDLLLESWEQCRQGRGRLIGLVGEAGIGKSRLAYDLQAQLATKACLWITVTCPSAYKPGPYEIIKALLRHLLNLPKVDRAEQDSAAILHHIEEIVQTLPGIEPGSQQMQEYADLIGELLDLHPSQRLMWDTKLYQHRLVDILGRLIGKQAITTPVVLCVDDLHWSDEASLEVIHLLTTAIEQMAVLMIALFRSESDWQPPWWNRRNYRQIRLDALDTNACSALLSALLNTTALPTEIVEMIFGRSYGNPLFIRELVASLRETGMLQRSKQGWRLVKELRIEEIPVTLQRMILARIERLTPPTQRIFCQASVIGDVFDRSLLQGMANNSAEEARFNAALIELEDREFLYRAWSNALYHFRHPLMREVAYAKLINEDRCRYHRQIGELLEQQPARYRTNTEQLAHHFYASVITTESSSWVRVAKYADDSQLRKAIDYLVQAGNEAHTRYAARDALRHYQRARHLVDAMSIVMAQQIPIEIGLGEAYQMVTQLDEALAHFTNAYQLVTKNSSAEAHTQLADLTQRIGRLYEWKSEFETALSWLEKGLAHLDNPQRQVDLIAAAALRMRLGSVYYNQGELETATAQCQLGLELATATNAQSVIAEGHNLLGIIFDVQGQTTRSLTHYEYSLETWQTLGNDYQVARLEDNIGQVLLYLGKWPEAQMHLEHGYAFWEKSEDQYNLAFASLNLGMIALYRGDWANAQHRFDQARGIWSATQNQRWVALCHTNLGLLALAQQTWAIAEQHFMQSRQLLTQAAIRDLLPEVYYGLAEVALGRRLLTEAVEWAQQALHLAIASGMQLEQALALRALGKASLAAGNLILAHQQLEESLTEVRVLNNRYEIGRTLLCLANLHHAQASEALAQAAYHEAVTIFQELGAQADLHAVQHLFL